MRSSMKLAAACEEGDVKTIEKLIKNGADVNEEDCLGETVPPQKSGSFAISKHLMTQLAKDLGLNINTLLNWRNSLKQRQR